MDTSWANQFFGLEPFEESQGSATKYSSLSPPDATGLPPIMETRDTPKHARKKSIFSRRSSKRANTAPPNEVSDKTRDADAGSLATLESTDNFSPSTQRSIIPDPLSELPAWFNKEGEWATSPVHLFRSRYPIHNPVGPRYYRNHHLLPPSSGKRRPSSVFSPSFPPMAAEVVSDDPGWKPGPSRTPSGSPLPTPSSSQTRIPDGVPKRTRKLSNTPHDAVDLLDASDPWGSNWHHQSPYDIGINSDRSPVSPDAPDLGSRSRMASFNGGPRHKTATPSPLSQSTSAIHLQTQEFEAAQLARKLSKRPGVRSVFSGKGEEVHDVPVSASAPVTPIDPTATTISSDSGHQKTLRRKLSKLGSGVPPTASQISIPASVSAHSVAPSKKKEKRGSMLGRLAKRFSVMRKGPPRHSLAVTDEGHDPSSRQGSVEPDRRTSSLAPRIPSPEKPPPHSRQSTDVSKRVPSPSVDAIASPSSVTPPPAHPDPEVEDRKSSISLEAPFSIGRLTIANPDYPSSSDNSPARPPVQLPPQEIASPLSRTISRPTEDKALPTISAVTENHPQRQMNGFVSSPVEMNPPALVPTEMDTPSVPPKSPVRRSSEKHLSSSHQGSSSRGSSEIRPSLSTLKSPSRRSLDQHTSSSKDQHASSSRHSRQGSSTGKSSSDARQGSSSTRHASRLSLDKQSSSHQQSHSGSSSTRTSNSTSVLFPKAQHQAPVVLPAISQAIATSSSADDSPLSKASILVNPPTPQVAPVDMRTPAPAVPAPVITNTASGTTTANGTRSSSRDSSPTKKESSSRMKSSSSVKSRETETFRLVRSPSAGQVHTTGETFVVHGEQWEVVESPEPAKRSKTLKEDPKQKKLSKRESRRQEKEREKAAVTNGHARAASMDSVYQQPPPQSQLSKSKPKEKESSSKKRKSSEHRTNGHRSPTDAGAGRTSTAVADDGGAHLERHPSTSARPTSEIPSAADLNAFRARDAWEMDRLWKGRSMAYGIEGPQVVYTQSIGSSPSVAEVRRSSTVSPGGHGSSHTSYKLQTPFHGHDPSAQHHTHIPSHTHTHSPDYSTPAPTYLYPNGYRSYPDISTIPSMSSEESSPSLPALSNPLPDPPRRSTYEPPPLPPSLASDAHASAEYWSRFAGVVSPSH